MATASLPPIISHDELGDYPDAVLCDCRAYLDEREGIDAYRAGHIPGAIFMDLETVLSSKPVPGSGGGRHPLPSPEVFTNRLSSAGIEHDTKVVAYDDVGGAIAGRLVWMLRTLGQPAAILDGGLAAYAGELETNTPAPISVPNAARPWPEAAMATASEVEAHISNGGLVIDCRGPDRYAGLVEPIDPVAGHIPGAVNLPFAENLADGRFRSTAELEARFSEAGVDEDTIYYCGSGVTACHNLLAAEAAGLGKGKLYVGSWSGWTDRPDPLVATSN